MDAELESRLTETVDNYLDASHVEIEDTFLKEIIEFYNRGGSLTASATNGLSLFDLALGDGLLTVLNWMFNSASLTIESLPSDISKVLELALISDIDNATQNSSGLTFPSTNFLVDNGIDLTKVKIHGQSVRNYVSSYGNKITRIFEEKFGLM